MLVDIDKAHMQRHVADYAPLDDWTEAHFLRDLPEKWSLSFALWPGPIGFCILSRRNGVVHLNRLMVRPGMRGQGYGSRMMREALRRGVETLKVHPTNEGAIRFYRRHGFGRAGAENGYLMMRHHVPIAPYLSTR